MLLQCKAERFAKLNHSFLKYFTGTLFVWVVDVTISSKDVCHRSDIFYRIML